MTIPLPSRSGAPVVPPIVRTVAYYVALVTGAAGLGAIGVSAAVWPDHVVVVTAVAGSVTGTIATIAGGLGVAYAPTRPSRGADDPAP